MNPKDLKQIHDQLYNLEVNVPVDDWDTLKKRLPQAKKTRAIVLWRNVAAAMLLVLFLGSTLLMIYAPRHRQTPALAQNTITAPNTIAPVTQPRTNTPPEPNHATPSTNLAPSNTKLKPSSPKKRSTVLTPKTAVQTRVAQAQTTPQDLAPKQALYVTFLKVLSPETTLLRLKEIQARRLHINLMAQDMTQNRAQNIEPEIPQKAEQSPAQDIATNTELNTKDLVNGPISEEKSSSSSQTFITSKKAEELIRSLHDAAYFSDINPAFKYNAQDHSHQWDLTAHTSLVQDSYNNSALMPTQTFSSAPMMAAPIPVKATHHRPVTYEVMVSRQLVGGLYANIGVSYTNIHSKFVVGQDDREERNQYLSYVGIPLELSYHFIEKKYVYAFFGLGTAFEKGVYNYNTSSNLDASGNRISELTTSHSSIDGFQISTSGNVGLGVNLSKWISIYARPSMTWYIPNSEYEQPENLRTVEPLTFNLGLGLRILLH